MNFGYSTTVSHYGQHLHSVLARWQGAERRCKGVKCKEFFQKVSRIMRHVRPQERGNGATTARDAACGAAAAVRAYAVAGSLAGCPSARARIVGGSRVPVSQAAGAAPIDVSNRQCRRTTMLEGRDVT